MSKFNINQATSKTGEFIATNKKPLPKQKQIPITQKNKQIKPMEKKT